MVKMSVCIFLLTVIGALSTAHGQVSRADEAALENIIADFQHAWTKCDAHALAGLWTGDGDFLSPYGWFAKGRTEIEKFYTAAFAGAYCGSTATGAIRDVRLVRDDVAVIDGDWNIKGARDKDGRQVPEEKGLFTAVAKREAARWVIVDQREMIPAAP